MPRHWVAMPARSQTVPWRLQSNKADGAEGCSNPIEAAGSNVEAAAQLFSLLAGPSTAACAAADPAAAHAP